MDMYGYVWISGMCGEPESGPAKMAKQKAEYSEYLCVTETIAIIAIACKMGVSKLGDP